MTSVGRTLTGCITYSSRCTTRDLIRRLLYRISGLEPGLPSCRASLVSPASSAAPTASLTSASDGIAWPPRPIAKTLAQRRLSCPLGGALNEHVVYEIVTRKRKYTRPVRMHGQCMETHCTDNRVISSRAPRVASVFSLKSAKNNNRRIGKNNAECAWHAETECTRGLT